MTSFTVIILSLMVSLLSVNAAGYYPAPAPAPIQEHYEDRDYKFAYAVNDDPTYNQHSREESKYGNVVSGQYTVLEPNGDLRVVNYVADENGFRAEVQKQPQSNGYAAPAPAPHKLKATYARTFRH